MAEQSAVRVEHVSKRYRIHSERNHTLKTALMRRRRGVHQSFLALDDVSFDVEAGSTFGIIGSNGSGKSTTLKVLAGILEPDEGRVTVKGRVSALLELGAGFHGELSGRENIFLNAAIIGVARKTIQSRMDEIIHFSGLGGFIDNPVKTYSSGMYGRLGFSVMIHVDPDVLLIDEVLAVGDEEFQRRCISKIESLRVAGRTVILVSHGLGQVKEMCDHVAWIEKGTLRALGAASDVVREYLDHFAPDGCVFDALGRPHYGTGDICVSDVRVLVGGELAKEVAFGDHVVLEIDVLPLVSGSVLEISIARNDGVVVTGGLSRLEASNDGRTVRFSIPSLRISSGSYDLIATVIGDERLVVDRMAPAGKFVLESSDPSSFLGIVDLGGVWSGSVERTG
jgi:ABC-2 type transport system ATP-binding protein